MIRHQPGLALSGRQEGRRRIGWEGRRTTLARSRRRTPIASLAVTTSEKQDKRWANRNCRSALRRALKREGDPDATVLPVLRDVSDPWTMAKDGRSWFGHHFPELMRK